mgnify:CR=1 FL=1
MKISVIYAKSGNSTIQELKVPQFERSLLEYKCHHSGLKHFLFNGFLVILPKEKWDFIIFWDSEKFKSIFDLNEKISGDFLRDAMPTIRNYQSVTNDKIVDCIASHN